jgi:hypothetical protein
MVFLALVQDTPTFSQSLNLTIFIGNNPRQR